MTAAALRPPTNDNDGGREGAGHRVFVRVITTAPALPWDQSRQANLEARLGAPARLSEIVYRLRRLDRWAPRTASRFAAVYARTEDARRGLTATTVVEGRPMTVSFATPMQQALRLKSAAVMLGAVATLAAFALLLSAQLIARRAQLSEALGHAERLSLARAAQLKALERMDRQARALDAAGMRGRRLAAVLADVAGIGRAKTADAHILALHWDHGFVAVEATGDASPFGTDTPVEKAKAPVRPGVSLWGLRSAAPWTGGRAP